MKKIMAVMLGTVLLGACGLTAGCGQKDCGDDTAGDKVITQRASLDYAFGGVYKKNELADSARGFSAASDVKGGRFCINGNYAKTFTEFNSRQDVKLELFSDTATRMVNVSGGWAYTLPSKDITVDYTIAKYRTQVSFADSILTVSAESSNPYTSNANPWYIYCGEWLINHLLIDEYYENQNLKLLKELDFDFNELNPRGNTTVKPGFDVYRFDIEILDAENIERPFYNIAVVRDVKDEVNFSLFVMKSKSNKSAEMDEIVQSVTRLTAKGVPKNYFVAGTPKENPNWSADTREYYRKLMKSNTVDWGVFSWSMPGLEAQILPGNSYYQEILGNSLAFQKGIERAWDHKYDIYPTYTHLGVGTDADHYSGHYFPLSMARQLAGGNGKNGKPVLQFTSQFTLNNNLVAQQLTPMFDIMRGKFDEYFHRLARDIKEYKEPILFRLNNEMNTDWTSYCGMMTLLDPDVFVMTWQRMYDIFEEEGVDNVIWIWNPIHVSCPYSSWGEDLCYFPGVDYVQLLGATSYEMNNYAEGAPGIKSFAEHYQQLYLKNAECFEEYGVIISEFACGSGGNYSGKLGRNAATQAEWVRGMFAEINKAGSEKPLYIKQIKGAVWFNCNDYSGSQITNRLRFFDANSHDYDDLSDTLTAFKEGFANAKEE